MAAVSRSSEPDERWRSVATNTGGRSRHDDPRPRAHARQRLRQVNPRFGSFSCAPRATSLYGDSD
jgi:hypothetical protein